MATRKSKKPYYYAGGKRVVLEPAADLVAVDAARLAEKLPELASDAALRAGKPLRDGIRLVQRATLAPETLQRLRTAGVTQPVFRQGGAVMVALPEIRIEDKGAAKLAAARKFAAGKIQANTGAAEGRSTLQLLSKDGGDAVTLAKELVEHCHLTSVSPRFLRVVPGPVVRA